MAGGILEWWRARLGKATPGDAVPAREVFIEEDFFGEIEVLPAAMTAWCREELRKIAAFSDAHLAPGGVGWTDIYVRPPVPMPLADLKMPLAAALATLGERLLPFDRVTTGSFSTPEPIKGARAFGPSPQAAVVVIADEGGALVRAIMLVLEDEDGDDAAQVMAALKSLAAEHDLIAVDWAGGGLARP